MLKIYCYSKCTTCKKALKWLDDNGIEYALTDIKTDHSDEAILREYHTLSGLPMKRFFNTRRHSVPRNGAVEEASCNERG